MFIDPRTAIKEGWVTGIVDEEKQVQPNAIDYTLDKAFGINDMNPFYLSETKKVMKGSHPIDPQPINNTGDEWGWTIRGKSMLDGLSDMYVELPEGVAAILVPRSTLVRNGLFTQNGLYDSGFKGHIGTVVHNRSHFEATLGQGVRIGQIVFVEAQTAGMYAGGYNHDKDTDLEYQK